MRTLRLREVKSLPKRALLIIKGATIGNFVWDSSSGLLPGEFYLQDLA